MNECMTLRPSSGPSTCSLTWNHVSSIPTPFNQGLAQRSSDFLPCKVKSASTSQFSFFCLCREKKLRTLQFNFKRPAIAQTKHKSHNGVRLWDVKGFPKISLGQSRASAPTSEQAASQVLHPQTNPRSKNSHHTTLRG